MINKKVTSSFNNKCSLRINSSKIIAISFINLVISNIILNINVSLNQLRSSIKVCFIIPFLKST